MSDVLQADAEYLLTNPPSLIKSMGWSMDIPINKWKGVEITNGRIWSLSFFHNRIEEKDMKELRLPDGLQILNFLNNSIGDEGVKGLQLPDGLQKLFLDGNSIINDSTISKKLIQRAKTAEGKAMYAPVKLFFDFRRCKPIWKEICRGLIFGKTEDLEDPIFKFMKLIHGSRNIRENILMYFNPEL